MHATWMRRLISCLIVPVALADCRRDDDAARVAPVVYCSVDPLFAEQVFKEYEKRTGVMPRFITDTEASKTTGLVTRIRTEAADPKADLFWSSELFNTIRLAHDGLLEPYDSPAAKDIPSTLKDKDELWTAMALRGRVIAFDPARTTRESLPEKWEDLAREEFASRLVFANPLFGTTRGHVAAMFAQWGDERARDFLTSLGQHALMIDGNSSAVRALLDGRAELAMTDTDDVWVAQRSGASIELYYPDMGDGATLWIPNSVALIKGGPNPEAARELFDFLVSADVERMLAESASRNVPAREHLRKQLELELPTSETVDYKKIADAMPRAVEAVREILIK